MAKKKIAYPLAAQSSRTVLHPPRATLFRHNHTRYVDICFRILICLCGVFVVLTTGLILTFVAHTGVQGIREVGLWHLLTGRLWKPEANLYGGLPLILGTLITASGAVVFGGIPALFAALWVSDFAPLYLHSTYRRVMEISAAVPSVVFGWLAMQHLVPTMDTVAHLIYGESANVSGEGLASGIALLAVMIAPTVVLLSIDAFARVPSELREASAALGASPWQTALRIVIPYAWRGLVVAVFFGFARAAGETMAVQMVIGGARKLAGNGFSPTTTIATQIIMDMQNSRSNTPSGHVLFSMSLILLLISMAAVMTTRILSARSRFTRPNA